MKKKIIPYNPQLVPLARKLRNNSTLSEILLWKRLRNKQFLGYDFDRQKPIGNYIVDFYCAKLMLAIEIDGCSHDGKAEYDLNRHQEIEDSDVTILHFDDVNVKQNLDGVLYMLKKQLKEIEDVEK